MNIKLVYPFKYGKANARDGVAFMGYTRYKLDRIHHSGVVMLQFNES
jgi:hypothetical protein